MKKSRIAKLALMGASITALAATLTTSTYAWYVSNKEASVKGGTGTTGSAGSDGSVLVSWTGAPNTFFKEIDFANAPSTAKKNALMPCHYSATDADDAAAPGFYGVANNGYDQGAEVATYVQFTVYVKTGNGGTVTPSMQITTSKGSTNVGQVAWVATGLPSAKLTNLGQIDNSGTTVSQGSTFFLDAKYAMYVQQNDASNTTKPLTYVAVDSTTTGGNAHNFYYDVQGWWNSSTNTSSHTLWATSPAVADDALGTIATVADTAKAITYTIFLDGADTDCFNACGEWDINFKLSFTIA